MGLNPNNDYKVGYYIGCDWLIEGEHAIAVEPKMGNLDYWKIFSACFNSPITSEKISSIYQIDFTRQPINMGQTTHDITPLIVFHFLLLVKNIANKGLKRDYSNVEENLQSKIKGKMLFSLHVKKNFLSGHRERNFCRYGEYSTDCMENRVLKKALCFVKAYMTATMGKMDKALGTFNFCFSAFEAVSANIETWQIKQVKTSAFHKEYTEAIRVAKIILQRFGYDINRTRMDNHQKVPPYYIDMPLLFECYIYTKLIEKYGSTIYYHPSSAQRSADFGKGKDGVSPADEEKVIIDAKYKLRYNEKNEIDDIRQISGYARTVGIRIMVGVGDDGYVVDCLIIYPDRDGIENFTEDKILDHAQKLNNYIKFHKIGIKLPVHC